MSFDSHINLLQGTIQVPPTDALNGTDFILFPGDEQRFTANMPVTLSPADQDPTYDNSEIGYLTDVAGTTLTILRGQEGSLRQSVAAGWVIRGTVTAKSLQDIEEAVTSSEMVTAPSPPIEAPNGSRTTFTVSGPYSPGLIWVTLNGLLEPVAEAGANQFSFADPPLLGDAISVWFIPSA